MTEAAIIDRVHARLRRLGLAQGNGIVTGIGDDCAIFRQKGAANDLIFTADMMHEGVHFTWDEDPRDVGHKALARSLSDCAAMGARPLFCLLSLALPASAEAWADSFYTGFLKLAKTHKVILAGGDLSNTAKISCDVTVCGEVPRNQSLLRSKARPGDRICASGPLGRAALALDSRGRYIPQPRLVLGQSLYKQGVRCAMDLSDGLSMDLARLCLASGCSAELDDVPIARGATLQHALHGGEDYELLFTVPSKLPIPAGARPIGKIVKGIPGQVFYYGQPLPPQGWDHFRPQ
ncbi:MAG TPA: thiamine-phosphate kinase [Bryobacteraceae bacterium]|nr:thiamine-phosphate kinase [Bryobacteraceae bacterium]